ncbi:MAG: peptidoglycan DD-metalloendopeptidase family protein [Halothiobacillaceae bacterium]|nr:peptidoglycan DD-metalloendopeptidase family protein [Halothiobacillaceae bacterium]
MLNRIFGRARTLFLGWVIFGLGQGALYAAPTIEEAAQELRGVQQDIKAERERLARLDAERDAEAAKLRTLENQQAEAARAVYAARFAVSSKESELVDLRAQHVGLEADIAAGLVGLEDNMRALYLLGEEHVLEGVLSPGDRAQKMRIEGYLAQLRASRVDALSRLRAAREANVRVQHEIEFALEDLTRMQLQAESEQATLDGLRAEHAKTVDALEARHSAGEAKVRQMNRDHAALERTLQKLELAEAQAEAEAEARALAEKKQREVEVAERRQEEAERLKRAQQAQQDEAQKARDRDKETAERSRPVKAPEKPVEKAPEKEREKLAEKPSEPAEDKKQHARGASPVDAGDIPVSGRKVRGFGDPTGVGELRSRGVFFAAPEGSRVRARADGKVVFADWVRGYGNLVIVQHKGSYLSLYAQNEAVLKSVGARVQRGEVLATAGRSGGERQTGVYVEVRRGSQPINPTRWSAWPKK